MDSFLFKPRWVAGHLLVLVVVVVFVNLGLWQLRRLDERRDFNATVEARMAAPVESLGAVLDPADRSPGDALWHQVEATGTWDADREVFVRNRSFEGSPGYHVLTPLVLGDGRDAAVYVNRGWVPRETGTDRPSAGPAPSAGTVTVTGLLRPSEQKGRFGPSDPDEGVLRELNRADLERLREQSPWAVVPAVLVLESQDPQPRGDLPLTLPPPDLSEGNHLSYAIQWFSFTAIVLIGWPLVLRRQARSERKVAPPLPNFVELAGHSPVNSTKNR